MPHDDGLEAGVVAYVPELYRIPVTSRCDGLEVRISITVTCERTMSGEHDVNEKGLLPHVQVRVSEGWQYAVLA